MDARRTARFCPSCGIRLARDNRGAECSPCQAKARDRFLAPPNVPADFWEAESLQAALEARHMGQLVRAYRHHPHHGHRPLSQGLVAGWLHITQAQLSRIESGPPITDLDRLIAWARTLGVPSRLLWFKLPESPHQFTAPTVEAVEQSEQTDHEEPESPLQPQGFSILPVVINGHPVLVPFDAHTLAASGLGDLPTPLGGAVAGAEVTSPFPQGSVPGPVAASALPGLGLEELERVAAALEDSRRYLDGPVVDYFRAQLEHAKRDDGALGPKKTLPVVLGLPEPSSSTPATSSRGSAENC